MRKFRRSILGSKSNQEEGNAHPEPVSVHLESTSTVLDDLRGQPTWEEEWQERHPGMVTASNHERKVHLLSDVLGQADGIVALREVLQASPALRALMAEASVVEADQDYEAMNESLRRVEGKLGEGSKFKEEPSETDIGTDATNGGRVSSRKRASPREFYHHRNKLRSLLSREENTVCADCTAKQPTWASVNLGVFLCTQCAGCHRSMGVHISKVLSVQLDEWSKEQVDFMGEMGNSLANMFLEYHVPSSWQKPSHREPRDYRESYVKAKYQERLFEFRGRKKPVVKAPPSVDETLMLGNLSLVGSDRGKRPSQAMTEYIGFVNIVLVKGKGLVPPGMMGQLQYMSVLRIGTQEVRSRWAKADGNPTWSEKLMLCWDGTVPLNIDVYGGKEHIGQAEVSLRKYLLKEDHHDPDEDAGNSPVISGTLGFPLTPISINGGGGGMDQSMRSESSSSGPPTLSSLSATNSTTTTPNGIRPGRTPHSRVAHSLLHDVAAAALEISASASSSRGGGSASPSPSLRAANKIFGHGGYPAAAATTPSESAIGGGGNPPPATATTAEGKRVFVQPMPASVRVDSVERRSSRGVDVSGGGKSATSYSSHRRGPSSTSCGVIDELDNGDLYVRLLDKANDRSTLGLPMPGSATASPRPASVTRNFGSTGSSGGSLSGSMKGKGLKNLVLGMTGSVGGASSAGGGGGAAGGGGSSSSSAGLSGSGGYGNGGSRPAQGGVIIKIDFVRIEH